VTGPMRPTQASPPAQPAASAVHSEAPAGAQRKRLLPPPPSSPVKRPRTTVHDGPPMQASGRERNGFGQSPAAAVRALAIASRAASAARGAAAEPTAGVANGALAAGAAKPAGGGGNAELGRAAAVARVLGADCSAGGPGAAAAEGPGGAAADGRQQPKAGNAARRQRAAGTGGGGSKGLGKQERAAAAGRGASSGVEHNMGDLARSHKAKQLSRAAKDGLSASNGSGEAPAGGSSKAAPLARAGTKYDASEMTPKAGRPLAGQAQLGGRRAAGGGAAKHGGGHSGAREAVRAGVRGNGSLGTGDQGARSRASGLPKPMGSGVRRRS
jgi:hypothetical protein